MIRSGDTNMLYTTNFANLKKLPDNIIPIAICAKSPDWYNGLEYKKLAPKYEFFIKWKETGDADQYIKCYFEQVLEKLNQREVYCELRALVNNSPLNSRKDMALVCYESPDEFCHRHLVRDWLNSYCAMYNIKCEEWSDKNEHICLQQN